jgi:flagellar biosynthesis chaperone FliJ
MWKNKATILSFLPHLFWVGVFFCIGYKQSTQYQPIFRETDKSLIAGGRVLDSTNRNIYKGIQEGLIYNPTLFKAMDKGFKAVKNRADIFIHYLEKEQEKLKNNPIRYRTQQNDSLSMEIDKFCDDMGAIYVQFLSDSIIDYQRRYTKKVITERIEGLSSYLKRIDNDNYLEELNSRKQHIRKQLNTDPMRVCSFLNKYKIFAKNVENELYNKIAEYPYTACDVICGRFFPIIRATKSYSKIGEEHNIIVALASSNHYYYCILEEKPVLFAVNNAPIPFKPYDLNYFSETPTTTGKHTLDLKAQVYNYKTKKYESAETTFEYTVAEKPLTIRTPLQTILYKDIQQPIYFRGLDETIQKVSSAGGKITTQKGDYFITPYTEDSLEVILETKEETRIFVFKVKPLPYPTATLSNKISDGTVSIAAFQELSRQPLELVFKDLEEKVSAKITNFTLTKISGSADIIEMPNTGNKLCATARNLVQTAKKGDIFVYENITVQIAGEATERVLAPLIFKVK